MAMAYYDKKWDSWDIFPLIRANLDERPGGDGWGAKLVTLRGVLGEVNTQ